MYIYEASPTLLAPQVPPVILADERRAEQHRIPVSLAREIRLAASTHGIPIPIAFSLVRAESNFTPHATGAAGEVGLTQVMPPTGLAHCGYTPDELRIIDFNLNCGFSFLRAMHDIFDDWNHALIAYNRGAGRLSKELRLGLGHGISTGYARGILSYASGD